MEKIVNFLITVSVSAAVLLALILVALLVYYIRSRNAAKKMLASGRRGKEFVYDLLCTSFPKNRIFKEVPLPLTLNDGTQRKVGADILLVDRGGIFAVRVINAYGAVDNPQFGEWSVRNSKGETRFANPFDRNRAVVKAVEQLLKKCGIYNVPVYNLVVFSGKKVVFRNRKAGLLTGNSVIPVIKDMNREKFLNQNEVGLTVSALKKFVGRQ